MRPSVNSDDAVDIRKLREAPRKSNSRQGPRPVGRLIHPRPDDLAHHHNTDLPVINYSDSNIGILDVSRKSTGDIGPCLLYSLTGNLDRSRKRNKNKPIGPNLRRDSQLVVTENRDPYRIPGTQKILGRPARFADLSTVARRRRNGSAQAESHDQSTYYCSNERPLVSLRCTLAPTHFVAVPFADSSEP